MVMAAITAFLFLLIIKSECCEHNRIMLLEPQKHKQKGDGECEEEREASKWENNFGYSSSKTRTQHEKLCRRYPNVSLECFMDEFMKTSTVTLK
jgi:hypothetical protein